MSDIANADSPPRHTCAVCGSPIEGRSDRRTCGATCRQRLRRGTYVVTEEDRAAIDRVMARLGHGHPRRDPLTPEEIRAHVAATAVRT